MKKFAAARFTQDSAFVVSLAWQSLNARCALNSVTWGLVLLVHLVVIHTKFNEKNPKIFLINTILLKYLCFD